MIEINSIGDSCPIPVIKAKNALKEIQEGEKLSISVDNLIATQNLKKLANETKSGFSLTEISENHFIAEFIKGPELNTSHNTEHDTIAVICSDKMGQGDDDLGTILMKSFIYALSELEIPPKTIIFYNRGAVFTSKASTNIEDLEKLQSKGTNIITCGACIDFYNLELAVGNVSNMYSIVEEMFSASKIIKP